MTEKQIAKYLEGTKNLFITGPAGTGKSYLLREYIETHKNVLVCAPTGIAALNVGGDTMHKVFHIPIPAFEPPSFAKGKKGALTNAMLLPIAKADTIIIDEISMARSDVFSFAIKVIRKAEKLKGSKIRLIVSGDFSQLPPVVKKTELPLMKKFGFDESGYAFTTPEWKSCNFKVIELTDVKRQEDREFIEEVNKIRIGDYDGIAYFNRFIKESPDTDNAIIICGTNAEADRMNQEYLDALPGNLTVLQSKKEGRTAGGYIDDMILVKEGCRVIFTSNDIIHGTYKNGTFGTIKSIESGYVLVEIDGNDEMIWPQEYRMYSYSVNKNMSLEKKEIGMIRQFPFKLGKAITIHKSQGQTFEKVVINPEIFAPGQLYVVLSRVKSPEGMSLISEIKPEHLIIDEKVQKFYDNGYKWAPAKRKPKSAVKKKASQKKTAAAKPKKTAKTTAVKKKPVKKADAPKKAVKAKTATKKPARTKTSAKTKRKTAAKR